VNNSILLKIARCAAVLMGLSVSSLSLAAPNYCTWLIVGDSLSAAYGLPREQGWVALLEKRMKVKLPGCSVVNASVSGETSAGGKARLPALLKAHQPSHVMIELGGNDALRGLALSSLKTNLLEMVNATKLSKAKVLLVGIQVPPNYGQAYTSQFESVFRDVSKQTQTELVPSLIAGFAEKRQAFQTDGIHPNAEYQEAMLNNVWGAIQKLSTP
jgi:acyl-CoA thioesterase-1